MPLLEDLQDEGLPATGFDEKGRPIYSRILTNQERSTAQALRIEYMDADARAAALLARPDLAARLDFVKRDLPNRRDLRDKYQDALTDLDKIINAETMTAAQVVQAVKFLARTVKFILKMIARQYRAEMDDNNG